MWGEGEGGGKGLTCTNLSRAQTDAMKDASIEATSYLLLLWSAPLAHRIECRLVSSFFFGFLYVTYVWSVTSGGEPTGEGRGRGGGLNDMTAGLLCEHIV